MRLCSLLVMIIFISGCNMISYDNSYKPSNDEKFADAILAKVANKLKQEKDLQPCGSGGQMMDEIKMLALSFDYYKPLDIKKGRELLIAAVQELVNAVNADEKIRPYLFNYPFKPKNVEIRIFLYDRDRTESRIGELSVISAIGGKLEYDIDDPITKLFITIHEETFNEALKRIKARSHEDSQTEEFVLKSA